MMACQEAAFEFEALSFVPRAERLHGPPGECRSRPVRPLAPLLDDLLPARMAPPADAEAAAPSAPEPAADPDPSFSQIELDEAVAAAREEGLQDGARRGRAEALQGVERRLADAAAALTAQLRAQVEAHRHAVARSTADLDLVFGIVRAIIPRTLEQAPLADVAPMLAELMAGLVGQAKLELRLPPDLLEPGRTLLADMVARAGFEGDCIVTSDPDLEAGDACLRWDHGFAERRVAAIVDEVEGILRSQRGEAAGGEHCTERGSARGSAADEEGQS